MELLLFSLDSLEQFATEEIGGEIMPRRYTETVALTH